MPKELRFENGEPADAVRMCGYHEIVRGEPDPDCDACQEANRAR